jgi:PTH1 family peptidyl-tRNA hydrolase
MKLIIGLGNPGFRYRWTRHNLGFQVIDKLAKRNGISLCERKFDAVFADTIIGQKRVVIVKPLTYVNLSGKAVKAFVDQLDIDLRDITVICDDLNLEIGRIRIRQSGGNGGHNGLKSIIDCLNSEQFPRLRIGIARGNMRGEMMSYVLGKFEKDDKVIVKQVVDKAAEAAEVIIKKGVTVAMNRFNN